MRGLFATLVLLFLVVLGLGLYFDWFSFAWNRTAEGKKAGVTFNVNRGQIASDTERAGQAVKNLGHKIAPASHGAPTHTAKGTLMNVDMTDRQLTLTTAGNQELTVLLQADTRIRRDDVVVNMGALVAGDRLQVTYRDENGKHVAETVTVLPGA